MLVSEVTDWRLFVGRFFVLMLLTIFAWRDIMETVKPSSSELSNKETSINNLI